MTHLHRSIFLWTASVLFASLPGHGVPAAPAARAVDGRNHRMNLKSPSGRPAHFRRYLLLILSAEQSDPGRIDQADLVRLVSLLLEPSGFSVQSGRALTASTFPQQVDQARKQAENISAAAVVWYRMIPNGRGTPELFLHLLDLLTDKTLVRTIKVTGTGDLERAAALKLWALLRASLLEMRADRGAAALPAPVAALTKEADDNGPGPKGNHSHDSEKNGSGTRLSFSIAYGAGLFFSGKGFHHGAEISADILIKKWKRRLTLSLGPNMVLPARLDASLDDTSMQINLLPLGLNFSLWWNSISWFVSGALRAGILVLSASADLPDNTHFHITKADPTTGLGIEFGWRPTANTALVARLSGDALWLGQCFQKATDRLCLDRMRLWAGAGFRLDL